MKDKEARTPLHYAAGTNNGEIARMLIEAGAQVEVRAAQQPATAPHIATRLVVMRSLLLMLQLRLTCGMH